MDELTYNKLRKIIRYFGDGLMELEDGSILKLLGRRPGKEGEKIILKKNDDPKPGGPRRINLTTLITAVNINGGDPQPVTIVKSPHLSDSSEEMEKNYTLDAVKTQKEYKILEIYPEQNSFLLACGKFVIDILSIPKGKRFDYGEDDILILYPSTAGKKNKFKAVNAKRKDQEGNNQEAGVMFLPDA